MPSNIPSYVYSLFAALIIGVILVSSCSLSMENIKNQATKQQLTNIDEYVATQCLILVAHATGNIQNLTQFLDVPTQIGHRSIGFV